MRPARSSARPSPSPATSALAPVSYLVRLDSLALTAPGRTHALAVLCEQLNAAGACYPGTNLVLCYEVKPHPGPA